MVAGWGCHREWKSRLYQRMSASGRKPDHSRSVVEFRLPLPVSPSTPPTYQATVRPCRLHSRQDRLEGRMIPAGQCSGKVASPTADSSKRPAALDVADAAPTAASVYQGRLDPTDACSLLTSAFLGALTEAGPAAVGPRLFGPCRH